MNGQMDNSSKKSIASRCHCWSPSYKVRELTNTCGGCHPEELIDVNLHETK